ncbi:MAG: beta-ketoacyl synthase N-terminal-like domain-containing protein [Jatrophihabitantaceae bacterium]
MTGHTRQKGQDMQQAANTELDIAVVGIAGRFPQAPSVTEFWRTLCEGTNATERLTDAELVAAAVPDREISAAMAAN